VGRVDDGLAGSAAVGRARVPRSVNRHHPGVEGIADDGGAATTGVDHQLVESFALVGSDGDVDRGEGFAVEWGASGSGSSTTVLCACHE
jgi:hypothetical protein